jgi:pyruvate kinase
MLRRRTKIVATIGPASETFEGMLALIDAGMNVARLNFSHGDYDSHQKRLELIRAAAVQKGVHVAIMQDLSGPKIRTGPLAAPVLLPDGGTLILTNRDVPGDAHEVGITYDDLPGQVEVGDTILLADGAIELRVLRRDASDIHCRVVHGGELDSHKGINLPRRSLKISGLTAKDKEDLKFGLQAGVDCVAMSFVRNAGDILQLREHMQQVGRPSPIIAKIEKHEALADIDGIIAECNGLMVARGDLAVETSFERVPLAQKELIEKCNQAGKPVITATQMLKSMVDNPRPTRAEAADVANAVWDGTDAVMLSEETAIGKFPLETVQVMDRILRTAETRLVRREHLPAERYQGKVTIPAAISHAVCSVAYELKAAAIVTPTQTGATARMVARYRPNVPIIAITPMLSTVRQLALVWGVHAVLIEREYESTDELLQKCKQLSLATGLVQPGDVVVIAAGLPPGAPSTTNLIKVESIE